MEIDRIYRLKTGTQPVRLLDYDPEDGAVMIEYCRSGQRYMRDASDLVPYEDHEKGDVPMAKQLFQIKGTDKYAHRIATDSQGRAVVEVKGTGAVEAVDLKDLLEVLPYSVGVKFHGVEQTYHYWAKPDSVKVGDLLIITGSGNWVEVVAVDTKSKLANKWLEGWNIGAVKLESHE